MLDPAATTWLLLLRGPNGSFDPFMLNPDRLTVETRQATPLHGGRNSQLQNEDRATTTAAHSTQPQEAHSLLDASNDPAMIKTSWTAADCVRAMRLVQPHARSSTGRPFKNTTLHDSSGGFASALSGAVAGPSSCAITPQCLRFVSARSLFTHLHSAVLAGPSPALTAVYTSYYPYQSFVGRPCIHRVIPRPLASSSRAVPSRKTVDEARLSDRLVDDNLSLYRTLPLSTASNPYLSTDPQLAALYPFVRAGFAGTRTSSMDGIQSYIDHIDSSRLLQPNQQGQQRQPKRPPPPGPEQVKHRRTRSCRKGKRECTYPGAAPSSMSPLSGRGKSKVTGSPGTSSSSDEGSGDDDDDGDDVPRRSSTIVDNEGAGSMDSTAEHAITPRLQTHMPQVMPRAATTSAHSTSTSSSSHQPNKPFRTKQGPRQNILSGNAWASLPKDVRGYLRYHRDSLSYHHYAFKHDGRDFLKTTFLEIALNDAGQALLYSIVAFSAYHHAISHNDGRILGFLKGPISTCTIIIDERLTQFQEFLGDWVTLLGHQKAAHQILTSFFTPDTIVQDETRLKIVNWYIRFDLFAGILSGGQLRLERVWYTTLVDFYARRARHQAEDLDVMFDEYFATIRLLATDAARLVTAKNQNMISEEQYAAETVGLVARYNTFHLRLNSTFTDSSYFVKDWPRGPQPEDDFIVDFRDPNFLFGSDFFVMNYVLIDFWTVDLNLRLQVASMQGSLNPPEFTELAIKICKMLDAIQYSDQGPLGAVIGCQAGLGMASLFLPKDPKHVNWLRRRFALIEQHG
nr:hypothetical protein CFP56_11125 [Quercus suber]